MLLAEKYLLAASIIPLVVLGLLLILGEMPGL